MSFTRTASGMANYHIFYGVDYVVYIEGKKEDLCCENEVVLDTEFYSALLPTLRPDLVFKIKPVGNCDDVVDHVRKANAIGNKNAFGFIDRDAGDLLYSTSFGNLRVIATKGYSWENDLWTIDTVKMIFSRLSLAKNSLVEAVGKTVEIGSKRLAIVSRLDFASRVHGLSPFKKNRGSCGFAIDSKRGWGIPKSEVSRLIKKYREMSLSGCGLCDEILLQSKKMSPQRVVQGHLLVALACGVISEVFRKLHAGATLSHAVILNTAISVFKEKVEMCLGTPTYNYYGASLARLIS